MEMDLPAPYIARPYRGPEDHPAMASILGDYHRYAGSTELPTAEQFDVTYANLTNCDTATDIMLIESGGEPVGYVRTSWEQRDDDSRDYVVFSPTRPAHIHRSLFVALVAAQESHLRPMAAVVANARFRAYAPHPGPGIEPTNESAWLTSLGYEAVRFEASLVRSDLENIPDLPLPDGVEIRAVTPEMLRPIFEAHWENFRGNWDFTEFVEEDFQRFVDDPLRDETMWKIAWAGDTVVGQVKSFINPKENAEMGYLRGYAEYISTHAEWRNKGIAGALLAASLREIKARGMTEAALGVDTSNPGGAFQLYTKLGFELRAYEAAYAKPLT
ncbi:MAG: GNAT family N-acetyltransferase [Ilumatobacteraceae bacterium]|nr:GNAT family N-acetyltransferase [Ilumatobacteraceae bacterium]